ncbi:hypothetical protein [Streptomyces smyrnaeus]
MPNFARKLVQALATLNGGCWDGLDHVWVQFAGFKQCGRCQEVVND